MHDDGGAAPSPGPLPRGEGERSRAFDDDIAARTDSYFNRTRRIVARFGDKRVTYAVFMRRPVISAPRLMVEWLETAAARARHAASTSS